MKTKFVIILAAQSLVIFVLLIYAFFQKSIADEQTYLAQKNLEIAQQHEKRCLELMKQLEKKHN